jgi:hypothetical protein
MHYVRDPPTLLALWFLTGFGGGTIFIRGYFSKSEGYRDAVANYHIAVARTLGVFICLAFWCINLQEQIFTAAALSCVAAAVSISWLKRP